MPELKEGIFREYDIRGIAASELADDPAERIAAAAAAVYVREGKRRIAVGMDGRPSSPRISGIVSRTLSRYGMEVIDLGLVPTPVVYFAVYHRNLDGAMVVTASHNPPEYNGLKVLVGRSTLFGEQIRELYIIAAGGKFPPERPGSIGRARVIPEYLDYILQNIRLNKKIKVVIDGGNGTAGLTAGELYRRLGAEVTEIFCEVDGRFPHHHPDPTREENLLDLMRKVAETGADLGIAFDGDADRIGVVDGTGAILWGDQLMVIFARDILRSHPGATIISEVKASEVLYSEIRRNGGVPIMWKAGHSLIKKKISEENALLAGEMSGHIFFNDKWFGFDDAVYAGARLLEILGNQSDSLAQTFQTIPKTFNTPEIRIDTTDEAKFKIVSAIQRHFKPLYEVNDIDGARIRFPHGWALVRASNTQPALVVRFEADSPEHLGEIRREVETALDRSRTSAGG